MSPEVPVRRLQRPTLASLASPFLAVILALGVGALILWVTGYDFLEAYAAMLRGAGADAENLSSTLGRATPIVGMGLAAALAFRAGYFNLGGEGQMVIGALAASLTGLYLPLPGPLVLLAALLAGAVAGGAWAGLGALCRFRFSVPLLVATLLLNYPARFLASYLVNHPFRDVASGLAQTFPMPEGSWLPLAIGEPRVQLGTILVLALIVLAAVFLVRTPAGYRMRMTGLNPRFARYGGVDLPKLGFRVLFLSGAVAGVVGAIQIFGEHHRFIDDALSSPGYAWTGLMAALLCGSRPLGVLVAGLIFAAVQTGGVGMERETEVPRELSRVLQALILLLVATRTRLASPEEKPGGVE